MLLEKLAEVNSDVFVSEEPINKRMVTFDKTACYDVDSKDFVLEALLSFINGRNTLSSLAIAAITGTEHYNVIKKIEKLLADENLLHPNFQGYYIASNGKENRCYLLPQDLALTVLTSYSSKISMVIMKRWMAVETGKVQPMYLTKAPSTNKNLAMVRLMLEELEAHDAQLKVLDAKVDSVESKLHAIHSTVSKVSNYVQKLPTIQQATRPGEINKTAGYLKYGTLVSEQKFYQFLDALNLVPRCEECISADGRIVTAKFYQIVDLVNAVDVIINGAFHAVGANGKHRARFSHKLIKGEFEIR